MQLPEEHPAARQLGTELIATLERNTLFMAAALP
jgi:PKHD-type hydroxylase